MGLNPGYLLKYFLLYILTYTVFISRFDKRLKNNCETKVNSIFKYLSAGIVLTIADPEHDATKGCPNMLEQDLVVIQLSLGELVDGHRRVAGIHQLAIGQGMVAVPDVFGPGVDVIIDKQQIFISQ